MSTDNLGKLSRAHMIIADGSRYKAKDHRCIHLAELCSIAVDFIKTGQSAEVPPYALNLAIPYFLEGPPHQESPGIMGKLYRQVQNVRYNQGLARKTVDIDLLVNGYERYIREALELKKKYNAELLGIMNYHGLSEKQVITGSVKGDEYEEVISKFEKLKVSTRCMVSEFLHCRASACYFVMYNRRCARGDLISFPWCLLDLLARIKSNKN